VATRSETWLAAPARGCGRAAELTDALERDGWVALKQAHAEMGLRVNARTGVPRWRGERMDYSWAVGVLQGKAEGARQPRFGRWVHAVSLSTADQRGMILV